MQHYQRCKRQNPEHTSACFLVLATKGPWNKYRPRLRMIKAYPKGTPLYRDPRTNTAISSLIAMLVLYDEPTPLLQLHAFADDIQPLHMTFPSRLAGQDVDVLVDTGASHTSHSFLDEKFAHGFSVHPDAGSVNCGGDTTASITGSATLLLTIHPGFRQRVKFYLTKVPQGYSVILGNSWLIANKVLLNHDTRTMEATTKGKKYKFLCPEARSSIPGGGTKRIHHSRILASYRQDA
jgi:hypothetical protein